MTTEPSPILRALAEYRAALERREAQALNRLIQAYGRSYQRLSDLVDALLLEIQSKGVSTLGQLSRLDRYNRLQAQILSELQGLQQMTIDEVFRAGQLGVQLGARDARGLLSVTVSGTPEVAGAFNVLPTRAIENLLGFLDPTGPLYERLQVIAPNAADAVSRAITEGVTLGRNPRVTARAIQDAFGQGLTDALRNVRTAQIWSYREANRATYLANSDVVEGWIWFANLDDRVCMSCVANHGKEFPLSETLNDHHNGRCSMIPKVVGFDGPEIDQGQTWFEGQPEERQRALMGDGKHDAWKAGKFEFGNLSGMYVNEVYGPMRVEQSLKALTGG